MKKAFKIIAILIGSLAFLFLAAGLFFFSRLPSPSDLGRVLKMNAKAMSRARAPGEHPVSGLAPEAKAETANAVSDVNMDPQNAPAQGNANIDVKDSQELRFLEDLMDPVQPASQACLHLSHSDAIPEGFKYDSKVFYENFKSALESNRAEKDPVILEMLAPIRLFLTQPKMQDMLQTVIATVQSGQESSFMEKAEFYAKLAGVYQEMQAQKVPAETMMDRGYYILMMARAVKKNPSLSSDMQMQDYCEKIEQSINSHVAYDREAEKAEFQNFLETMKIDPKDIGYDPNYQTHLVIEQSAKGVHFHGGWLDSLFQNQNVNIGPSQKNGP